MKISKPEFLSPTFIAIGLFGLFLMPGIYLMGVRDGEIHIRGRAAAEAKVCRDLHGMKIGDLYVKLGLPDLECESLERVAKKVKPLYE